jgi:murein DD-endopeptidase MepM/ murein hydrolase activator NlpD
MRFVVSSVLLLVAAAVAQTLPDADLPILNPELLTFVCPEPTVSVSAAAAPTTAPVAPPTAAQLAALQRRARYRALLPEYLARVPTAPVERLRMPVDGVRVAQIADTWHAPRGNRLHEGQDIFAPRGTPVRAATAGVVYEVSNRFTGGRGVMLFGPAGLRTFYTHLEAYAEGLREGMWVEAGDLLGYVGDDGNAAGTPPHLHFGAYAFDPETCRIRAFNPLPQLVDP